MDLVPAQLAALVAIADHGTFEAAARHLNVTASAISQRIRALESEVGQVVVQRTTPCRPTPAGEVLVRLARQTRLLHDEVRDALAHGHLGIVDLPVAYTENVERVTDIISGVVDAMYEEPDWSDVMLEKPTVAGVEQITGTTITIRVIAKTGPNQQWGLQRAIRERVKDAFDVAGVRAPVTFPTVPGATSSGGTTPGAI